MENRYEYLGEFVDVVGKMTDTLVEVVKDGYREDVIRLLGRYGLLLRHISQNIKENKYLGDFLRDHVYDVSCMYKGCELGLVDKLYNTLISYVDERLADKKVEILSSMLHKFSSILSNMRDTIQNDELAFLLEKFGSSCEILSGLMEGGYMVSVALQKAKKFANSPNSTDYESAKKLVDTLEKTLRKIWDTYDFELEKEV